MPIYFPQINGNMILTQLPYTTSDSFDTTVVDMESGPRISSPRRAASISGYPAAALGKYGVNFSNITDAEVNTLKQFFIARRARYEPFRFFDPGGNLLQYSEAFSNAAWDKSAGVSVGGSVTDPFGGSLAFNLSGSGSDACMLSYVGPSDGDFSGYRMTASVWVKAQDAGTQLYIGFADASLSLQGTSWSLPYNEWVRIFHSSTMFNSTGMRVIMGGNGTWTSGRQIHTFGFQAVAMKGSGAYVKTPGNYGYRSRCRFDTDSFDVRRIGPNQNQVLLPIEEVNA